MFVSELGMAQRKFAQCLGEFQFEYIGDAKTDDEKCIGKCAFVIAYYGNQPLVILSLWTHNLQILFMFLSLPPGQVFVYTSAGEKKQNLF